MNEVEEKLTRCPDPMTPEDLATVWDCSPDTIRGMCERKELRSFRLGRLWKINKAAVLEHMGRPVIDA